MSWFTSIAETRKGLIRWLQTVANFWLIKSQGDHIDKLGKREARPSHYFLNLSGFKNHPGSGLDVHISGSLQQRFWFSCECGGSLGFCIWLVLPVIFMIGQFESCSQPGIVSILRYLQHLGPWTRDAKPSTVLEPI